MRTDFGGGQLAVTPLQCRQTCSQPTREIRANEGLVGE